MNKVIESILQRVGKKVIDHGEDNFTDDLVSNVLLIVRAFTPREHVELITDFGGKAQVTDKIEALCKKSEAYVLKDLRVTAFKSGGYSIRRDSPLRTYMNTQPKTETEEKPMARAKRKSKAEAEAPAPAKRKGGLEGRFVEKSKTGKAVWEALDKGEDTALKAGEVPAREGSHTGKVVELLKGFGRKKVTGATLVEAMVSEGYSRAVATSHVTYSINVGFVDPA